MVVSMKQLNWDRLLDGGRYSFDLKELGTTLPALRAKAYYEAKKRGLAIRTTELPGNRMELELKQPVALSTELPAGVTVATPARTSAENLAYLAQLQWQAEQDGTMDAIRAAAGPPPGSKIFVAGPPQVQAPAADDHDPDDYDDPDNDDWPQAACTCGSWPKDQPSCRLFDPAAFQLWRQEQPSSEPAAPAPSAPVITGPTRDASTCTCGRYPDCGAECFNFDPALLLEP